MRRPPATPILALCVATTVGGIAMVRTIATMLAGLGEGPQLAVLFGVLTLGATAYAVVGVLIDRARPGNRIAWVMAVSGALIVLAFTGFGIGASRYALYGPDDTIGGLFGAIGAATLGPALFVAIPMLATLFPDGRLPGPRWRLPFGFAFGAIIASSTIGLVQPGPVDAELPVNPFVIDQPLVVASEDIGLALLPLALLGGALLGAAAVATRYRRSHGIEREQVKWLLGAVTVIALFLPASFVDGSGDSGFTPLDAVAMSCLCLLPLSVGVAITRYRLYEIDRLISRGLAWALLTGLLVATFAGSILVLQTVLAPMTNNDTLAVAASTLVAAALFQPLRTRIQRAVDRRFNRARVDAQRTIDGFGAHLRDEVDLARLQDTLVTVVDATVRPDLVTIWLRGSGASGR